MSRWRRGNSHVSNCGGQAGHLAQQDHLRFRLGSGYSKQQGYGAYDRNVIRPLNSYAAAANGFSPDHIQPGQFFAVRERASTIHLDLEPDEPIKGDLPNHFSKDWSWKCLFGAGGGVEIGGEAITFSFKNDRSGKETQFTYFGFGGGRACPSPSPCLRITGRRCRSWITRSRWMTSRAQRSISPPVRPMATTASSSRAVRPAPVRRTSPGVGELGVQRELLGRLHQWHADQAL